MSTLILAEKPDQARSYMDAFNIKHGPKDFLGKGSTPVDQNTVIVGARGHIIQLSEPEAYGEQYKDRNDLSVLPIIPTNFKYEIPEDKRYVYHTIREEVQRADRIIVATDPDNEGGAIAFNILRFCKALNKRIERAFPLALDADAVHRQFQNIQPIDSTWLQAQAAIARSRSDWLIGMNLSRYYTTKLMNMGIYGNYAIGRALTATLGMICNWNESIENFKPEPIYLLKGKTLLGENEIDLSSEIRVVGDGKNNPKQEYLNIIKNAGLAKKVETGTVENIVKEEKAKYAPLCLTRGGLYKAMKKAYGWSESKSKKIMQKNYDEKYQTYPRTDDGHITRYQYEYLGNYFHDYLRAIGISDSVNTKLEPYDLPEEILKKHLVPDNTDAAHLGIIPSEKIMDESADVTPDQRKMWEVVVRYSLALRMPPYRYLSNKMEIDVNTIKFKATNTGIIDEGYQKLLPKPKKKRTTKAKTANEQKQKKTVDFGKFIKKGDRIQLALHTDVSETKPLRPLKVIDIYADGGLMEKAYKYVENKEFAKILKDMKGIGTSATRDTIVESLINKKYISLNKKEEISVTPNGWLINYLMKDSDLSSPVLTARWEEEYKVIEAGKGNATQLITNTAKLVINDIKKSNENWNEGELKEYYGSLEKTYFEEESFGKCPQCDSDVIFIKDTKKKGKWDRYSCTNKDCDFVIWSHIMNKKFTDKDIEKMLAGEPSRMIKGLQKKDSSKTYDANFILKYDQEKKRMVVHLNNFASPDKKPIPSGGGTKRRPRSNYPKKSFRRRSY